MPTQNKKKNDIAIEDLILSNLITNEEYNRKVISFLQNEYFIDFKHKTIHNLISDYIGKYNKRPTIDALKIELQNLETITENNYYDVLEYIAEIDKEPETNLEWLLERTEEFGNDQAVHNAFVSSLSILDGSDKKHDKGMIPKIVLDALSVSLDNSVGHDYLEDAEERYEFLHSKEEKVPFDLHMFNIITKGGVSKKTLNLIMAGVNTGKAQPLNTIIPTPNGWKKFGDLKIGDSIFGDNGDIVRISGIFPQGKKEVYKITFWDGRTALSCKEHLWKINKGHPQRWSIDNLENIIPRINDKRTNTWIPLAKPVPYSKNKLLLHPYIMGCILGDGGISTKSSVAFTSMDEDIIQKISNLLPEGYSIKKDNCNKYGYHITRINHSGAGRESLIINALRSYNLMGKKSPDKHIPEEYLYSSIEDRFELLRGLMDTDGSIYTANKAIEYSSSSKILAEQVLILIRSLGGIAKISSRNTYYTHNGERRQGNTSYRVHIRMKRETPIFHCARKKKIFEQKYKSEDLKLAISKIELIGKEDCQCIMVDSVNHLYLTDDYVVTHNTLAKCHMAAANLSAGYNVLYITMEMAKERISERIDMNLLNSTTDELFLMSKAEYLSKIKSLKSKILGKLVVEEYAPTTASASHIRTLLNELKIKKQFIPDIMYIDYLNICASSRIRMGSGVNSYSYLKSVSEEIRGLSFEFNIPVISSIQLNRTGMLSTNPEMTDVAESMGIVATADNIFALTVDEELEKLHQIMVKQIKSRNGNKTQNKRFIIGVDYEHMRLYDVDDVDLTDLNNENTPIFDKGNFGLPEGDKFKDLF